MEKKKGLFELSLPLQFLIYYVASFLLFFVGFYLMEMKVIDLLHLALACLIISVFTASLMTGMIWSSNISKRFYEKAEALEKEANNAISIGELNEIRDRTLKLHIKEAFGIEKASETQRIITIIDARLKYEFKV